MKEVNLMRKYLLPEGGNFYKANLHCHTVLSDGKKTPEEVAELCRLDKWYSSDEACAAGLIDKVIRKERK